MVLHFMKQSTCLREITFTCLKTCNAVTSGIRFCGKISIFLCTIRRPSVCPFVRKQPSLMFTFIASPPKPLEEFCRNLAYEFLSMSRCVRPKMISVCQKQMAIFRIVNCSLLNTVTISLSHLLRDHCERSHQIFCILQLKSVSSQCERGKSSIA